MFHSIEDDVTLANTLKSDFNFLILRITALFWILFKAMSFHLWISGNRTFPLVPVIDQINKINVLVFDIILGLNLILLLVIILKPKILWLIGVLVTELILILADQLRLQPTIYQYILTISFFLLHPKHFKYYFLFLLSAIYILSGLHKLNLGYANFVWGKFILHDTLGVASAISNHPITKGFGLLLPIIELIAGVALLTKFRKYAFYVLILMHITLLLILGPLGANWNSIVWPWNIQMIIFALLYLKYYEDSWSWIKQSKIQLSFILVILTGLPVLSIFQKSFSQFLFNLYGGLADYVYVSISEEKYSDLKTPIKTTSYNSEMYISIFDWSVQELNVPYIDNKFYFKGFITEYKKLNLDDSQKFILRSYPYRKENVEVLEW